MKLFECQNCGQLVYFENVQCERCGLALGFLPDLAMMTALELDGRGGFTPLEDRTRTVQYCTNHRHGACNWLVNVGEDTMCRACKLNRTIPDIANPENLKRWQNIEVAKHRLVYSLMRIGLPLESKVEAPDNGLAFDFLAPPPGKEMAGEVLTGHDNGVITLNVAEADASVRTLIRRNMNEPYRTLLGHFRHEIAHYYWDRLIQNSDNLKLFRRVFGDESADYTTALKNYYDNGAPLNWQNSHISAYASAHPHEDWAETFAHYLHMIDTLETAYAFGLRIRPLAGQDDNLTATISVDPYNQADFRTIFEAWLPMTFAINSINRSMGIDDLYPFVISQIVLEKLKFVHEVAHGSLSEAPTMGNRLRQMVSWTFLSF